jgi:hypothetical protein
VLDELAPDVVAVVEGPNRAGELQLFFDQDVQGDWQIQAQHSKGQSQNIGIAVRVNQDKFEDPVFKHFDTNNIEAFDSFLVDSDGDGIQEQYKFKRRPMYAEARPKNGKNFRVLGLHLKSKGIFGRTSGASGGSLPTPIGARFWPRLLSCA